MKVFLIRTTEEPEDIDELIFAGERTRPSDR